MINTIVVPVNQESTVISIDRESSIVVGSTIVNVGSGAGDLTNYYTKDQTDTLLMSKANSPIVVNDIIDFDGTVMAGGTF